MSARLVGIMATLCLMAWAPSASGHQLFVFVTQDGPVYSGRAYFAGGSPAIGLPVQVTSESGEAAGELTTGDDGRFELRRAGDSALTFTITTPDGHKASFSAPGVEDAAPTREYVDAASKPPGFEDRIQDSIRAVREQLDELQQRLWLRDVLGAIGYIVGIFGMYALWKSRKGSGRAD